MQFFRVEGFVVDEKWAEGNDNRRVLHEKVRKISMRSNSFNQKLNRKAFFYVTDASEDTVTIGIICRESTNISKQISSFLNAIELEIKDICVEEITLNATRSMLQCANRNDYIDDDDDVLELFDLDKLNGRFGRGLDYGENIIDESNKTEIYKEADRYLARDTFVPELDRIFAGRSRGKTTGHPVHYFVQTDDRETRKGMYRLLLQALYLNGRLRSKRYSFLDFRPGDSFSMTVYDCLYKSSFGGAVIVRYIANDDTEDDYATCGRETIENICEVMKKYRNQVLTVFCLPRECTKSKDIFYENLGITSFVELKEEFVSGDRAERFLKMLAKDNKIRADKKLFDKLEDDKGYLAPDLHDLFDEWYNNKLKTGVYPQYKDIVTAKREVAKAEPKGTAYDELMEMIGIDDAKKVIGQALNYYKAQKLFADKGMKADRPAMHMVFTGNPGTAKTTVARLFSRIMKENDLLSKGRLVEVGRGDLVGKYVGWTAPTIQKKFRDAQGSVLFIDEAYSLLNNPTGREAISTLIKQMEDNKSKFILILAGYENEMRELIQSNPGFLSRIKEYFYFQSYSVEELTQMFEEMAKEIGFTISPGAKNAFSDLIYSLKDGYHFGNARTVRNILEKSKDRHSLNFKKGIVKNRFELDERDICYEEIRI